MSQISVDDFFAKSTERDQLNEIEDWKRAVQVEAEMELRAERFRKEVDQYKEKLQPSLKRRIINWIRNL